MGLLTSAKSPMAMGLGRRIEFYIVGCGGSHWTVCHSRRDRNMKWLMVSAQDRAAGFTGETSEGRSIHAPFAFRRNAAGSNLSTEAGRKIKELEMM